MKFWVQSAQGAKYGIRTTMAELDFCLVDDTALSTFQQLIFTNFGHDT